MSTSLPSQFKAHRDRGYQMLVRAVAFAAVAIASCTPACIEAQAADAHKGSTIHIWGHGRRGQDYIQTLLTAWQTGFRKSHPGVVFVDMLYGDASGIGSLYTGVGELAILDREASFIEVDAYHQGTGHDPFAIPVARGSVATPHHAPALIVYVNPANPLTHLSLEQLDGIFDADHRLSTETYKTWGDLGLSGDWASRPIQLYTPDIQSDEVQFFERAALQGSQKLSCCLSLYPAKPGLTAAKQIAAALALDKFALAVSTAPAAGLKAIPLSASKGVAPVLVSAKTISDGTYPLARTVYIYANREPKSLLDPNIAAFLNYIVSPEGQAIVAHTGGYLPLSPQLVVKAQESLQ